MTHSFPTRRSSDLVYDLIGYAPAYVANRGRNGHQAVGHVVIALPDGHVADAHGIWGTRDLLTHWGAAEIISTTPEEVRSDLSDEDGVLSDHCMERIARARRILQQDEQTYLARLASVTASVGEPEQEDGQPRP